MGVYKRGKDTPWCHPEAGRSVATTYRLIKLTEGRATSPKGAARLPRAAPDPPLDSKVFLLILRGFWAKNVFVKPSHDVLLDLVHRLLHFFRGH